MNVFQPLRVEATSASESAPALSECVSRAVRRYLAHSGKDCAQDLYRLVLAEVEEGRIKRLDLCVAPSPHSAIRTGEYPTSRP